MASAVVLEYPNGRTFATVVELDLKPGMEFELYGRRWRALGKGSDLKTRRNRSDSDEQRPLLCTALDLA